MEWNKTLFLWSITSLLFLQGCEPGKNNSKDNLSLKPAIDQTMEITKQQDFTSEERKHWEDLFFQWRREGFNKCLKKLGFKMDCEDCGDIYVIVKIQVGADGKIVSSEILGSLIDCEQKTESQLIKLRDCLIESFVKIEFPDIFKNRMLEVRAGEVTRC